MNRPLLITCGCSWTYGVGVGYQSDMDSIEYKKIAWDKDICDTYSFRGLLANKYKFDTLNFSHGGSSNQKQFRVIKKFLSSSEGQQRIKDHPYVVVLHGITSTARNEMYLAGKQSLVNFKYDDPEYKEWSQYILEYFYNHDNEVARLTEEMSFLNCFYKAAGIENIWFDTFNHHQYSESIDNLVGDSIMNRDMLSSIAKNVGLRYFDNNYHRSSWKVDSNRVNYLINHGYLNPISNHPTKKGHELIADILGKELGQICQKHNMI